MRRVFVDTGAIAHNERFPGQKVPPIMVSNGPKAEPHFGVELLDREGRVVGRFRYVPTENPRVWFELEEGTIRT